MENEAVAITRAVTDGSLGHVLKLFRRILRLRKGILRDYSRIILYS